MGCESCAQSRISGSCNMRAHSHSNSLGHSLPCASSSQVSSDASAEESVLVAIVSSLRKNGKATACCCTEPARFILLSVPGVLLVLCITVASFRYSVGALSLA